MAADTSSRRCRGSRRLLAAGRCRGDGYGIYSRRAAPAAAAEPQKRPAESTQGVAPSPKRPAAAAALLLRRGELPAVAPKLPAAEAVNDM